MGNISLGHSSALDASGKLHQFEPGEVLPDWVTAKSDESNALNARVTVNSDDSANDIIARAQAEANTILEAAKAEAEQIRNSGEKTDGTDVDVSDENGKVEESGEPDFTKPAQPKRGRPAKSQA